MRLKLQIRQEFFDPHTHNIKPQYKYVECEIESFRWAENHTFEYVIKGDSVCKKLENYEEIVGLEI